MNFVFLSGRLTEDPVIRYTQSGKGVCSFILAVDRYKKGQENECDFIRCQAWEKTAEYLTKYAHKGDFVSLVDCALRTGKYQDKDGKTVYTTDVLVGSIDCIRSKAKKEQDIQFDETEAGEIPF